MRLWSLVSNFEELKQTEGGTQYWEGSILTQKGISALKYYYDNGIEPEGLTGKETQVLTGIGENNPDYLLSLPQLTVELASRSLVSKGYIRLGKRSVY